MRWCSCEWRHLSASGHLRLRCPDFLLRSTSMRRGRLSQPTFCQVEHARAEHADADASVRSEPERPELQAVISRFERDVERLTELLQAESAAHAAVHATAQLVKQQLVATQNEAKTSEEQLHKELADERERARKFEIEAEHAKLRDVQQLAAEARRLSAQVERVSEERDLARQELQVATERLRILEQVESGLKMELAALLKERNEMVQLRMEASARERSLAPQVPRLSAALNLDEAREALTTDVLPG